MELRKAGREGIHWLLLAQNGVQRRAPCENDNQDYGSIKGVNFLTSLVTEVS
jgi:hypothetical protein